MLIASARSIFGCVWATLVHRSSPPLLRQYPEDYNLQDLGEAHAYLATMVPNAP